MITTEFNMNSTCFSDIPDLQVWTSSLVRTKQTAAYTKAPKQHFHEIDEINAGKFDGYTYDEVLKSHPEEFEARAKDKLGYRYPEGKSKYFTLKGQEISKANFLETRLPKKQTIFL